MATSLQKQLNFLKTQENKHDRRFKDNERPSMVFNFRVAASYSVIQIKEMALEGFANFCAKQPSFSRFKALIFDNDAYENLDREKLTKTDNDSLSDELNSVLLALSQNLNNMDALKILEYLLRNFEVHKYQSDFILVNFMHLHSTAQYSKLLQNIELNNPYKWYVNLNDPIIKGETIDRKSLVKRYLKHHPKILEDLLNVNMKYFDQVKRFNDKVNNEGAGYYLTIGDSGSNKLDNDSPSFRFFCALYIEYFESHKSKELLTLQKELFYRLVVYMINNNATGLLSGALTLFSFNIIKNNMHNNEVMGLVNDLIDFAVQNDEVTSPISTFILFITNYQPNKLDYSILNKIGENLLPSFLKLSDNYSVANLLINFLEVVNIELDKQSLTAFNDLYSYITQLLSKVVNSDVNYHMKTIKNIIIDNLANIFVRLSDNDRFMDKQTIEQFREIKNIIAEDIQHFLQALLNIINSRLLSMRDKDMQMAKPCYKKHIDAIFGNITYYGMFDIELLDSGHTSSSLGFKRLNQLTEDEKLKYCAYINRLITDKPISVKDKDIITEILIAFMNSAKSLHLLMDIITVASKLKGTKEFFINMALLFVNKCIDHNIIIPTAIKKQIQDIIPTTKEAPALIRAFNTLVLNMGENNVTYFNDIKRGLDAFIDLEYDNIIRLLAYFVLYDKEKKLVPKAILMILETPTKIKLTNNNFDEYHRSTMKIFNIAELVGQSSLIDVSIKNIPKIVTKIIKELVNFHYHGKPSTKGYMLEDLTIKAINFLKDESEYEEVIKVIDENYFMFMLSTFLLKDNNKYTPNYFKLLSKLSDHSRISKSIKNWGRLSKDLVTYSLVFLSNSIYSDKINVSQAKVSLNILKQLSLAFNEYTMRELNKKSKKANILKDIMVIVITNLHNFTDETRLSLLKKLRIELTKKIETSITEFIEFFNSALKIPDSGLTPETTSNYVKIYTIVSAIIIDVPYKSVSDLYVNMLCNTKTLVSTNPDLKLTQLLENLLVFFLKNGDYINYFEILKSFGKNMRSDLVLKELKRYIATQPDYIKVITFFYLYKLDNLLSLDDFKFSYTETFLLVRSAFYSNEITITEHLIRNISNYVQNLDMKVSRMSLTSSFGILKACLLYLEKHSIDEKPYLFDLIYTIVSLLKKESKSYTLKTFECIDSSIVQEDKLNLSLATILNHIEGSNDINDNFIDFYKEEKQTLLIDPSFFTSSEKLNQLKTILKTSISTIISSSISNVDILSEDQEIDDKSSRLMQIKTIFEYLTLFMNIPGGTCFNLIVDFFDDFKIEYKIYQEKLRKTRSVDETYFSQLEDRVDNIHAYENSLDNKKLEGLVSKLYFIAFDIFKKNKIKKGETKLMVLVLSYLSFNELRLASGIGNYLKSKHNEKSTSSKKIYSSAFKVMENLKTILKDVFGIKRGFAFIFTLIYYFSANFVPESIKDFIHLITTVVIDTYISDGSENSSISNSLNNLIYNMNNFIIASFSTPNDLDFDYIVSKDIVSKKKFMNNQDMLGRFSQESELHTKLLKRRLLILMSNLANQFLESKIYNEDLNEQIIYRIDGEVNDTEFIKNNALIFISFVTCFKKLKEFNKASIEKGKNDVFTSKMLKSIQDFKAISIKYIPVELYLMMLGEISTQIKQKKNAELILYSLLNIIIEKISKITLSKLFRQLLANNINILNQLVFDERTNMKSERFIQNYLILLTNLLEISPPMIEDILREEPNITMDIFDLMLKNENPVVIVTGFIFFAKMSTYFKKQLIPLFNRLQKQFGHFVIAVLEQLKVDVSATGTIKTQPQLNEIRLRDTKNYEDILAAILEYLYVIYVNFTNMMAPFVNQHICFLSILNDNFKLEQINDVLTSIVRNIEFRLLVKEMQNLIQTVNINNKALFYIISDISHKTLEKLDYDSFVEHHAQLFQLLICALKTCERIYAATSEKQTTVWDKWIDSFLFFFLKCNEKQLKQYISDLKKQFVLDKKTVNDEFRRYLYFRVQNSIIKMLGSMAISIYSESFDMIKDVLDRVTVTGSSLAKREKVENDGIFLDLYKQVVESLVLLTKNDNSTMIDVHKFEILSKALTQQITDFRIIEDKKELVEYFDNNTFEALSNLMRCRNDEYQIKTVINYLFKLVRDNKKLTRYLAILGLKKIIANLQELFLVYVNDVTPRLSYVLEDEDPRVAQVGKEIIKLLQEITGENIEQDVREGRPNFED